MTRWIEGPAIGLGCAALGNLYDPVSDDDARETVDEAWRRGVRFFDTAPLYGHGLSEQRLGDALASRPRDEFELSTKVGRVLVPVDAATTPAETIFAGVPPVEPRFDFSAAGVEASLAASAERLGTDRFDVVHVHDPDDHLHQAVTETFPALVRLRDAGTVGAIGLGTNHARVAEHVLDRVELDWLLLAGRYTLLDRSGGSVLDRCARRRVRVIAAGVFNSGLLADPDLAAPFHYGPAPTEVVERARALADLCADHGVPLAAAAIQFPMRHPAVHVVLPGARTANEVAQNLDLLEVPIPDELWTALDPA